MKVAILFFLAALSFAASIEKHYHYHFENLSPKDKRVLKALVTQRHRGWWGKFKCYVKHMFNKDKRTACLEEVKADEDAKKKQAAASVQVNVNSTTKTRRLNKQNSTVA